MSLRTYVYTQYTCPYSIHTYIHRSLFGHALTRLGYRSYSLCRSECGNYVPPRVAPAETTAFATSVRAFIHQLQGLHSTRQHLLELHWPRV